MAAAKRQQASATAAATKEASNFWTRALRDNARSRKGR